MDDVIQLGLPQLRQEQLTVTREPAAQATAVQAHAADVVGTTHFTATTDITRPHVNKAVISK